jgi:hypothetical protein
MKFNPKGIWDGKSSYGSLLQENNALLFYEFIKLNTGYVYIMYPPNRTDLLKVGLTKKNPFIRAQSLESAGVIGSFELKWVTEFYNVHWAEARVHYLLKAYHEQKEFFSTTLDIAKKVLAKVHREEEDLLVPLNIPLLLSVEFSEWFLSLDIEVLLNS